MPSYEMLRHVALLRTYVSEELMASIIRLAKLASWKQRYQNYQPKHTLKILLGGGYTFLQIVGTLQYPHGVTSQNTFFIIHRPEDLKSTYPLKIDKDKDSRDYFIFLYISYYYI
jgi:hypothetical protein